VEEEHSPGRSPLFHISIHGYLKTVFICISSLPNPPPFPLRFPFHALSWYPNSQQVISSHFFSIHVTPIFFDRQSFHRVIFLCSGHFHFSIYCRSYFSFYCPFITIHYHRIYLVHNNTLSLDSG